MKILSIAASVIIVFLFYSLADCSPKVVVIPLNSKVVSQSDAINPSDSVSIYNEGSGILLEVPSNKIFIIKDISMTFSSINVTYLPMLYVGDTAGGPWTTIFKARPYQTLSYNHSFSSGIPVSSNKFLKLDSVLNAPESITISGYYYSSN